MRTVLIAFYNVFPPDFGSASVTYNIAKYLDGEKYLIHTGDIEGGVIDNKVELISIKHIPRSRLLKMIALFAAFPKIAERILKLKPDALILENASWAVYYFILFSLIRLKNKNIKIIYHAHCVEYLLRKQKDNLLIAGLTRWAESFLLKNSDLIFSVSEADAANLEKIYRVKPKILPNGVDTERFDQVSPEQVSAIRKKYNLGVKPVLFMGLPVFKPNKEAINLLINEIFPEVYKEIPEARLVIIGGKINYKRPWLINPGNIPFEEVPVLIKSCQVCLAPIFSGSGVRLKILEYMAAARPVISSYKGAEGINIREGRNIILADDARGFLEKTLYLLRNTEVAKRLGEEAERTIRESYSWRIILPTFNKILYDYCNGNS